MAPQCVYLLIPESSGYVTLHGKRAFAGAIKLRSSWWEIILDYPGGPNVITRVFARGSRTVRVTEEVKTDTGVGPMET